MTTPCPSCAAPPGACPQSCPEERRRQARAGAFATEVERLRNERAEGLRCFTSAVGAVRWAIDTHRAWGSAKALSVGAAFEGDGTPNRGADDPKRRKFAAVVWAVKDGERAVAERFGACPRLTGWITLAVWGHPDSKTGGGWSFDKIAESDHSGGHSAEAISRRFYCAMTAVRERLQAGRWMRSPVYAEADE